MIDQARAGAAWAGSRGPTLHVTLRQTLCCMADDTDAALDKLAEMGYLGGVALAALLRAGGDVMSAANSLSEVGAQYADVQPAQHLGSTPQPMPASPHQTATGGDSNAPFRGGHSGARAPAPAGASVSPKSLTRRIEALEAKAIGAAPRDQLLDELRRSHIATM